MIIIIIIIICVIIINMVKTQWTFYSHYYCKLYNCPGMIVFVIITMMIIIFIIVSSSSSSSISRVRSYKSSKSTAAAIRFVISNLQCYCYYYYYPTHYNNLY